VRNDADYLVLIAGEAVTETTTNKLWFELFEEITRLPMVEELIALFRAAVWNNHLQGGGIRSGTWSKEEDDMVNMHCSKFGNKWAEISKAMANGRTGKQIKAISQ